MASAASSPAPANDGPADDYQQFMVEVAGQANRLSTEIVDVSGHVDTLAETVRSQAAAFQRLTGAARAMQEQLEGIAAGARGTNGALTGARSRVRDSRHQAEGGLTEVARLVDAVHAMGAELNGFQSALQGVGQIAAKVDQIAQQTNLLALNATIEASRVGALGAGFAVVAGEVKELSRQASRATQQIADAVERLGARASRLLAQGAATVEQAGTVQAGTAALGSVLEVVDGALESACGETGLIVQSAESAGHQVGEVQSSLAALTDQVGHSSASLDQARARVSGLIQVGEALVELTVSSGVETPDAPYVRMAVETAAIVGRAFEQAVARGEITLEALFSRSYEAIPGVRPEQLLAPFTRLTDRLLPAIQEPIVARDPRVVFCAAVDDQGYLATHNAKFSQRPGTDPVWNAAHCRNRRMFADRVGLAAARNQRPHLVQTYRRDMGGGKFALMKDASAPILVAGRHWGGLRIAYRL
jgi:methyl-accepting chemotaxis protein